MASRPPGDREQAEAVIYDTPSLPRMQPCEIVGWITYTAEIRPAAFVA
jgi:hypothetical protein